MEELKVVTCEDVTDLFALLEEGIKHRRIGSHELNKDSSRSHFILTLYVIRESVSQAGALRTFGKISFVDLAGSERLKDSKTKGGFRRLFAEGNAADQQVAFHAWEGHFPAREHEVDELVHSLQRLEIDDVADGLSRVS